jgi:cysteinyl-tRNA synthetase
MHNGFVRVDNEKMSKSLGNFFTIREVLAKYDAEVVRFFILRAHYRSPLNYSDSHLDDARHALTRLYSALREVAPDTQPLDWQEDHAQRFQAAMNDDFNTPMAVAVLFELANEINKTHSQMLARQLKKLSDLLGLIQRSSHDFFQAAPAGLDEAMIEARIAERVAAKKSKNFALADQIRNQLQEQGVMLEDTPTGTVWRRA